STRYRQASTGQEGLIGSTGKVLKAVDGSGGQVFVGGEYWQATSSELLDEGTSVRVVAVDGLRLKVSRDRD
ncbi:MAG: NfeD family protein, partial [Myxococcota bacterium]